MMLAALDSDLVREARGGSSLAFTRLVERHQGAVRGFLRRTCDDWAEADDLAQETFLTALERLGALREGASVRAWLCGIAWRELQSRRRSWLRRARRDHAWSTQGGETSPRTAAEDRQTLARAMAALPPEEQAAVALCLAAEFTQAEAAEALGLTVATVKAQVARGRARLLQELKVEDDGC